jgi:hypothetical protein
MIDIWKIVENLQNKNLRGLRLFSCNYVNLWSIPMMIVLANPKTDKVCDQIVAICE